MNSVKVRDVIIGEGMPKICVPIVGISKEEILTEAKNIVELPLDIVEWRADWFEQVSDFSKVKEVLGALREILGEIPLLFTFRTAEEGGQRSLSLDEYAGLNIDAAHTGLIDLIDVEMFRGDELVREIIGKVKETVVRVIGSNHHFNQTPAKEEMIERLCKMQELGADIPKLAVMPQSKNDVLTLLSATEEMASTYANGPIITMSMAGTGVISRMSGEFSGSALTFGAASKVSAPGQIDVIELKKILEIIHKSM